MSVPVLGSGAYYIICMIPVSGLWNLAGEIYPSKEAIIMTSEKTGGLNT